MDDTSSFVRDLVLLIRDEIAVSASESDDFSRGRALGLVQVLSLIKAQAVSFDVPLADIELDGIEPANLLTSARATRRGDP